MMQTNETFVQRGAKLETVCGIQLMLGVAGYQSQ
jgi:hypothetical protein